MYAYPISKFIKFLIYLMRVRGILCLYRIRRTTYRVSCMQQRRTDSAKRIQYDLASVEFSMQSDAHFWKFHGKRTWMRPLGSLENDRQLCLQSGQTRILLPCTWISFESCNSSNIETCRPTRLNSTFTTILML